MGIIQVNQVKSKLSSIFSGLIDISDCEKRTVQDKESAFLTRSLAAFTILSIADIEPEKAAKCVTDSFNDNGIDAIYFDEREKILFLVQSKWRHDGSGSIDRGECLKFITGVKDLINSEFGNFNEKIANMSTEISTALLDVNTRILLLISSTGQGDLGQDIKRDIQSFLDEMNDISEVINFRFLKQKDIHVIVASGSTTPINFDMIMRDWGYVREPYPAYYGRVAATDIAIWMEQYYPRIFDKNIRSFLSKTDINLGIVETLENEPEKFWYFNNGLTILCDSIKKKLIGGSNNDTGIFECINVSIVNGAQTVGAISTAYTKSPDTLKDVMVMVRFISLEKCPSEFAARVTRATNTQNRVENRDFISLDPEQERLRTDLILDGIEYFYKAGYSISDMSKGFEMQEATVALACWHPELSYAVLAKDKISRLWDDVNKPPYKALFNASLSSVKLWKIVQIYRLIENSLKSEKGLGREGMIPVHGNRFLARQVFRRLNLKNLDNPHDDIHGILSQIPMITSQLVQLTKNAINDKYSGSYLSNLFRNREKCQVIEAWIDSYFDNKEEINA